MTVQIPERKAYVDLMKNRALGLAPEMGSAIRMADVLTGVIEKNEKELSFIDVGCAGGHYLRSLAKKLPSTINVHYTGVDIASEMIQAATEAWETSKKLFPNVVANFVESSVESEKFRAIRQADVVFSANAFMYFKRPQVALKNMLGNAKKHCVIRSYFCDQTFIVKRAQTSESHEHLNIQEEDILDEQGEPKSYDLWNIYGFGFIEKLVKKIDPDAKVTWLEDNNPTESMKTESTTGIQKHDATQVLDNYEIVYPFILPWKYLVITKS